MAELRNFMAILRTGGSVLGAVNRPTAISTSRKELSIATMTSIVGEGSPMANLMLSVMGAFAEFERILVRERQRGA